MGSRKLIYTIIYGHAKNESQVHWHHEESPILLRNAVASLHSTGSALDIGCGTGEDSVFMARHGLTVTAIDFVPRALNFARMRARECGVGIEFIGGDIIQHEFKEKYDLIFDSGCLHSFDEQSRIKYKRKILSLLSDQSNYVLIHSAKANLFDLGFGPRPRAKEQIIEFFMPELKLLDFRSETSGKPMHQFWFTWN